MREGNEARTKRKMEMEIENRKWEIIIGCWKTENENGKENEK